MKKLIHSLMVLCLGFSLSSYAFTMMGEQDSQNGMCSCLRQSVSGTADPFCQQNVEAMVASAIQANPSLNGRLNNQPIIMQEHQAVPGMPQ